MARDLIPRCLQRWNNKKQRKHVKGINPETNSSGERNTKRLAAGYFIKPAEKREEKSDREKKWRLLTVLPVFYQKML